MEAETTIIETIAPKKKYKGGRKPDGCNSTIAQAMGLITNKGMDPKEAYMLATGKETFSHSAISRLKAKVEKWSLKHPDSLRSASKTIQSFAKGHDVNGVKPKDSTVLAAAQRIVDATDPVVKRSENLNVNVEMHPVDLEKYLG